MNGKRSRVAVGIIMISSFSVVFAVLAIYSLDLASALTENIIISVGFCVIEIVMTSSKISKGPNIEGNIHTIRESIIPMNVLGRDVIPK